MCIRIIDMTIIHTHGRGCKLQVIERVLSNAHPFLASRLCDRSAVPHSYLKKIIEDAGNVEETGQLLRYCSWENPGFSFLVLTELLWQISYSYNYELRPYLDLLLQLLLVDDSWQQQRVLNALKVTARRAGGSCMW